MSTRSEIIDSYARAKNYYNWIGYIPIGQIVVDEVERMGENGLYLSTACALLEKESGFKNLFGCDHGATWTHSPPYCQIPVTQARVRKLIANVEAGGGQNGIGYCQLTTISYVYEAEKMGGAHLPQYQMRVGFRVLLDHILNLSWPAGAAAYNAGAGNWRSVINTYGADMARLEREWAERLAGADKESGYYVHIGPIPERIAKNIARNHRLKGREATVDQGKADDGQGGGDKVKPEDFNVIRGWNFQTGAYEDFRMNPGIKQIAAYLCNNAGVDKSQISTYRGENGLHGRREPGAAVDVLWANDFGVYPTASQKAAGDKAYRVLTQLDDGTVDYVVWDGEWNEWDGTGQQPYNPAWARGPYISAMHFCHWHVNGF